MSDNIAHYSNAFLNSHEADTFDGFARPDISMTSHIRRRLSTLDAVEISSTFRPALISTMLASVLEPLLPPAMHMETDEDSRVLQATVVLQDRQVSGPVWNETAVGANPPSSRERCYKKKIVQFLRHPP